ncbi:hypothetical protein HMPREF1545_01415 [Oscillibacter sp. KLE 1728]|nr:hypothetical protein HMPREF1545_01415 [Oscillibacter sp. KLE 1728]ERK64862.1 hypothetical protein HMPREF1546_01552 [Oscillibacter sp. KLE 1745]
MIIWLNGILANLEKEPGETDVQERRRSQNHASSRNRLRGKFDKE